MVEIFSRVKMKPKQVITVVLFVMISSVAQMMIPTLVSTMINDGVGNHDTLMAMNGKYAALYNSQFA